MKKLALQALNTVINRYLLLDPDTIKQLATLDGKIIQLTITDWKCHFYIIPNNEGMQLIAKTDKTPDTTISGKLNDIFKAGVAKTCHQPLNTRSFEIAGDIELGETIRDIFMQLDIDWEEHLSRVTGDTIAHHIGAGIRKLLQIGKRTSTTLEVNLKEYLQEESQQLPTREEVSIFIDKISTLRDDVERFEARFIRFKKLKARPL